MLPRPLLECHSQLISLPLNFRAPGIWRIGQLCPKPETPAPAPIASRASWSAIVLHAAVRLPVAAAAETATHASNTADPAARNPRTARYFPARALPETLRVVHAELLAQDLTDLADRAAHPERLAHHWQQILALARDAPHILERRR